jgi:arsenate reductase (glutaredoxin)
MDALIAWVNPRCSKSHGLLQLLKDAGREVIQRDYLADPPSLSELEAALVKLGERDPQLLIRKKESLYDELSLDRANRAELLQALAAHPELLQRPILFTSVQAVIARPPELALELLANS